MSLLEELAWAAGFFDGEGTCGCYSRGKNRPLSVLQVSVGQTDPRPLQRFLDAVGVGKLYGPYQYDSRKSNLKTTAGIKPIWFFRTRNDQDFHAVYNILSPWLSGPKTEQFNKALTLKGIK